MADLIISQPMTFTVDVKNGIVERPQRESLMRGDRMANRIIAELMNGSEPFDITGVTVKGKFCRPPSGDEIDLAGEAKGNVAEVQLTDQCYTSGGHYEARVILVLGGVERTVLFISGDVLKSGSGNAAGDEETGGSGGSTGSGLPAGGTAGQVLVKVSSAQGDAIRKNLTADDVGARPADWMPTAADVGALPSNGTAVNARELNGKSADQYMLKTDTAANSAKLGGKAPEYYLQPRNLLDNSDFRNPVNQRGAGGTYDAWGGYTIDRWATYADGATVNLTTQGLSLYKSILQPIGADTMLLHNGKHLTYAVKIDGVVYVASGLFEQTGAWHMIQRIDTPYGYIAFEAQNNNDLFCVINNNVSTATVEWAALYEGSYTAETIPPYVPKGYAVELAECRLYYRQSFVGSSIPSFPNGGIIVTRAANPNWMCSINFDSPMRGKPTVKTFSPVSKVEGKICRFSDDVDIDAQAIYASESGFLIQSSGELSVNDSYYFSYIAYCDQ